jgi:hypothetical protein
LQRTRAAPGEFRDRIRWGIPMGKYRNPKQRAEKGSSDLSPANAARGGSDISPGALRSGRIRSSTLSKKVRNFTGRNTAKAIYTDLGKYPRSSTKRRPMNAELTKDLLAEGFQSAVSRSVVNLKTGKTELKPNNAARNHILADSRIKNMLDHIFTNKDKPANKIDSVSERQSKRKALLRFFTALSSDEDGARLHGEFRNVRTRSAYEIILHETSEGRRNLRIGLADVNGLVSNTFDPIVIDGRFSKESQEIHDAVMELSRVGHIPFGMALDSLAITRDINTHHHITSTVIRTNNNTVVESRTPLDRTAPPHETKVRRYSADAIMETDGAPRTERVLAMQPAADIHNVHTSNIASSAFSRRAGPQSSNFMDD